MRTKAKVYSFKRGKRKKKQDPGKPQASRGLKENRSIEGCLPERMKDFPGGEGVPCSWYVGAGGRREEASIVQRTVRIQ